MKKLIYLLLTIPLLMTSCTNDEQAVIEETVQVNFRTEIPKQLGTRASTALSVDKVECAVFEEGEEITALRENIEIVEGQDIVFSPRLIRGRTYNIVFWAYKNGSYDVTNMKEISRINYKNEEDYDAFTAKVTITVEGNQTQPITLHRPLAQLNIGVTEEDWKGVTETFDMTPTRIEIQLKGKNQFNALKGKAADQSQDLTYSLPIGANDLLTVENTQYHKIGMCYVLMEETQQNDKESIHIQYSIYDQSGNAIRENVEIPFVPLQANYKTHIVGGLLTGTITYRITINEEDKELSSDPDHNIEIE